MKVLAVLAQTAVLVLSTVSPSVAAPAVPCVKPLGIVDAWGDTNKNGIYDPGEPYDPLSTGWIAPDDSGTLLDLSPAAPGDQRLNEYWIVDLPALGAETPPVTGEAAFRAAMSGCSQYEVAPGDSLQVEPGLLLDALSEELAALISMDPGAYWDEATSSVQGSTYPESPRLIRVPFYDPRYRPAPGRGYLIAPKVGSIFLESVGSNGTFTARFVDQITGDTPTSPMSWGRLKDRY